MNNYQEIYGGNQGLALYKQNIKLHNISMHELYIMYIKKKCVHIYLYRCWYVVTILVRYYYYYFIHLGWLLFCQRPQEGSNQPWQNWKLKGLDGSILPSSNELILHNCVCGTHSWI